MEFEFSDSGSIDFVKSLEKFQAGESDADKAAAAAVEHLTKIAEEMAPGEARFLLAVVQREIKHRHALVGALTLAIMKADVAEREREDAALTHLGE